MRKEGKFFSMTLAWNTIFPDEIISSTYHESRSTNASTLWLRDAASLFSNRFGVSYVCFISVFKVIRSGIPVSRSIRVGWVSLKLFSLILEQYYWPMFFFVFDEVWIKNAASSKTRSWLDYSVRSMEAWWWNWKTSICICESSQVQQSEVAADT